MSSSTSKALPPGIPASRSQQQKDRRSLSLSAISTFQLKSTVGV